MIIDDNKSCRNCSYGCICYTAVSVEQILDDSSAFISNDESPLITSVKDVMITIANSCSNYDAKDKFESPETIGAFESQNLTLNVTPLFNEETKG